MKTWINKLYLLCLLPLALSSCEKDEEIMTLRTGVAPVLTTSAASMELSAENAENEAVVISWTAADYGYPAAVEYTLQFIKEGGDFEEAREVEPAAGTIRKAFSVSELNKVVTLMGLAPGNEGTVQLRVKSEISPSIEPIYSNVISFKVTPYLDIIEYASLWVPGSHQGWNPGAAPKVSSVNDNGIYEGYVNFADAKTNFKFTLAPNWDDDFGGTSSGNKGTLAAKASDLEVNGAGYYLLKANTKEMTWEAIKTTWGVIGDATAAGWDSDQDLTYDAVEQVWKGTLNLKAGELKFRANDAWGINFGDDNADGSLEYGAANIKVLEAGNYQVTLNLGIPGNYNYTLIKL